MEFFESCLLFLNLLLFLIVETMHRWKIVELVFDSILVANGNLIEAEALDKRF